MHTVGRYAATKQQLRRILAAEHLAATREKEAPPIVITRVDLEGVTLNEVNQTHTDKRCENLPF